MPTTPTTAQIQKSLESIEEDLTGTIDGWFGEIEGRLTEIQDVLRSAALRKVLSELGKLKIQVVEKLTDRVADARAALELHDNEVEESIEAAAEAAEEPAEVQNAA